MKYIKKIIDNYDIVNKIYNLAENDFKNKKLEESIFLFIEEGGRKFFNTFLTSLNKYFFLSNINIYSIKIRSYNNKNKKDSIKIDSKDLKILEEIYNRDDIKDVYIFDDIIDSGETFRYLVDFFKDNKNVSGYFLIDKINRFNNNKKKDLKIYYKSLFNIETTKFVFGFGMDIFNCEYFRELDDIYIFND